MEESKQERAGKLYGSLFQFGSGAVKIFRLTLLGQHVEFFLYKVSIDHKNTPVFVTVPLKPFQSQEWSKSNWKYFIFYIANVLQKQTLWVLTTLCLISCSTTWKQCLVTFLWRPYRMDLSTNSWWASVCWLSMWKELHIVTIIQCYRYVIVCSIITLLNLK